MNDEIQDAIDELAGLLEKQPGKRAPYIRGSHGHAVIGCALKAIADLRDDVRRLDWLAARSAIVHRSTLPEADPEPFVCGFVVGNGYGHGAGATARAAIDNAIAEYKLLKGDPSAPEPQGVIRYAEEVGPEQFTEARPKVPA